LDSLIRQKLGLMKTTMDLRQNVGLKAAQEPMLTDKGNETMDAIRQLIRAMENDETANLPGRANKTSASLQRTIVVTVVGAILSLTFLSLSFYLLTHEVRKRRQAAEALQQVNDELDKRVEQLAAAREQGEQQLHHLTSLHAIDRAILGATDLRLALKTVLEETTARLKSDMVAILLFNPDILMLEVAAVMGNRSPETNRLTVRLGDGISGQAALERRTIGVPNLAAFELSAPLRAVLTAEDIQAMYVTPLIAKGSLVGVLNVSFRSPFNASQSWLEFLERLGEQAAIAVDSGISFDGLKRSNLDLTLAYDTTLEGWSHALELRDNETKGHTLRVAEMTLKLARIAGMTRAELVHVRRGALLHDIGKMAVPDAILFKPGKLTDEESALMRKHPTYAYELLWPIAYLRPALDIPYCHHEKWDGSGYPRGLKGEQIPLAARLFAVVDVWDALRCDRPYRKRWSDKKVLEHVRSLSGTHFDSRAVDQFLGLAGEKSEEQPGAD
jgi:putative nucleotidyltransferase with HDIG domain